MAGVQCSLLLELPDKELERRFWEDENVLRTYINFDEYICSYLLISNSLLIGVLYKALFDATTLARTWHLHVLFLINGVACSANLALIFRYRSYYKRHRHRIIIGQRLLRLMGMLLTVYQSSYDLQTQLARALNGEPAAAPTNKLRTALLNLMRPLFLTPGLTVTHSVWFFKTKYWVPLQLLTFLLAVFGSVRYQYCRLAADPSSALLLQPACRAVADLHSTVVGAILGPLFVLTKDRPAACGNMAVSARVLGWYAQAIYGVFIPFAAYCTFEWRLKARWVKETLGRQLQYGPLSLPQSRAKHSAVPPALQSFVTWLLVTAVCWVLLWEVITWVVPQLPMMPCHSCEDTGACRPITCEGRMCSSPGVLAAVAFYFQSVAVFMGHLASTCLR